ncbi:MAG: tetratricopeptide repeat protein [Planctomycetes bacterium]|nr:tetratricopeptide repeat protein [Planctomycetota bacterium]
MDFFRSLNKEQWTALLAAGLCALLLLFGIGGGDSAAVQVPKSGAEEPYVPLRQRYVELPDENWKVGKNIFGTQSSVKLALPVLKAPEPREEEMPAPAFRPGPAWEIYNRLGGPLKYPMLTPGAPLIAEANLPTAAEVAELSKLEEPAPAVRPDLREKRDREFAIIKLKNGNPIEAQKADINGGWVTGRRKNGSLLRISVADVVGEILQNRTYEEQYKVDSEQMEKYGAREADERLKLAQRCIEQGMLPEAKAELKKAIESRKDHLEAILLLGQLAQESLDFETALGAYRAGLDAGAAAGELWYEIGRLHRTNQFHEGALAAFEKAVEAQPRLHRARIALARGHLESGNVQAAIDAGTDFFTKLGNAPDTTPAHRAEAFAVRGTALVRAGQLEKARADFAETLKLEPANAEALNGNGAAFALEGQFPQAGPEFVKAIRANPYLTEAWTNLAGLFLLGGKWAEAEQLSAAAVQRDPASAEALLGLGLAQILGGKKEGPATVTKAEQADPRNLQVLMVTGLTLLRQEQDEEALQKFVSALRQEYFFLPAYSGAAAAYLRTARKLSMARDDAGAKKAGELRINAATLLQRVRDVDPNRPGTWTALACAYAAMQRPDDARRALREAKENDPLIYYTRGYIEYYYAEGEDTVRVDLARREFEQAVKLETTATDPFSRRVIADCKWSIDQADQWRRTEQQLLENFNGPDAKSIGGGWLQAQAYGVAISRDAGKDKNGRGKFSGKQVVRDWGLTVLSHEIQGGGFSSLEITLYPEKMDKAEYGVSLFHTKSGDHWQGFSLGFDSAGKAKFSINSSDREMDGHDMNVGWTDIKIQPPNPKEILVKITVSEKNRARFFNLWWWNAEKGDWILAAKDLGFNANAAGTWRVAAWTRAWRDQDLLLYVDNIRVLEQSRR